MCAVSIPQLLSEIVFFCVFQFLCFYPNINFPEQMQGSQDLCLMAALPRRLPVHCRPWEPSPELPGLQLCSRECCSRECSQESWIEPTASRFVVPAEWWMQQGLPRLLVLGLGPWGARAGSRRIWRCEQGKTLLSAEGTECLCPEFPSGCPTAAVVLPLSVLQPHGRGAVVQIGCISPVLFILLSRAVSSECYSSLTTQNQGGRGGPVSSNTPHSQYNFIELLFVGLIHCQCWRIMVILVKNQSSQHHKALPSYQIPDLPNIWSFSRAIERFGTSNRKKLK